MLKCNVGFLEYKLCLCKYQSKSIKSTIVSNDLMKNTFQSNNCYWKKLPVVVVDVVVVVEVVVVDVFGVVDVVELVVVVVVGTVVVGIS